MLDVVSIFTTCSWQIYNAKCLKLKISEAIIWNTKLELLQILNKISWKSHMVNGLMSSKNKNLMSEKRFHLYFYSQHLIQMTIVSNTASFCRATSDVSNLSWKATSYAVNYSVPSGVAINHCYFSHWYTFWFWLFKSIPTKLDLIRLNLIDQQPSQASGPAIRQIYTIKSHRAIWSYIIQ